MSDLLARLDEDEAAAKAVPGQAWYEPDDDRFSHYKDAAHIARHSPARVLRDVAARRQIIALCETETDETGGRPLALRILRILDGVYGDDPDLKENEQ
jgi:uncharacterized protein DUF6221